MMLYEVEVRTSKTKVAGDVWLDLACHRKYYSYFEWDAEELEAQYRANIPYVEKVWITPISLDDFERRIAAKMKPKYKNWYFDWRFMRDAYYDTDRSTSVNPIDVVVDHFSMKTAYWQ